MNEIYIFAYYFMLNLAAIHGIILGVGGLRTLYFCSGFVCSLPLFFRYSYRI